MNDEEIRNRGEVIKRWIDGETLQYRCQKHGWLDLRTFDGVLPHAFHDCEIRIKKRVAYINLYVAHGVVSAGFLRDSRKECDDRATPGRIACVRVEYEEGQFDD